MQTLILLHGWGATGAVWQKQSEAFTEKLLVQAPTIPTWEPDWLEDFLQNFSLADCFLVGWSLGGMLLLEVLARRRSPVGGLALVGVAPVFCLKPDHPWGQSPAAVRAMRRALKSDPGKVLQDFAGSCLSKEEEAFQGEVTSLFNAGNGTNLIAGLDYLMHQDLRLLLPRLPLPPTIIQGGGDNIVPPKQAWFLHEQLPGSSLHLLPDAGHLPFWTQAEVFNKSLDEIMKEEAGPPGP